MIGCCRGMSSEAACIYRTKLFDVQLSSKLQSLTMSNRLEELSFPAPEQLGNLTKLCFELDDMFLFSKDQSSRYVSAPHFAVVPPLCALLLFLQWVALRKLHSSSKSFGSWGNVTSKNCQEVDGAITCSIFLCQGLAHIECFLVSAFTEYLQRSSSRLSCILASNILRLISTLCAILCGLLASHLLAGAADPTNK